MGTKISILGFNKIDNALTDGALLVGGLWESVLVLGVENEGDGEDAASARSADEIKVVSNLEKKLFIPQII